MIYLDVYRQTLTSCYSHSLVPYAHSFLIFTFLMFTRSSYSRLPHAHVFLMLTRSSYSHVTLAHSFHMLTRSLYSIVSHTHYSCPLIPHTHVLLMVTRSSYSVNLHVFTIISAVRLIQLRKQGCDTGRGLSCRFPKRNDKLHQHQ